MSDNRHTINYVSQAVFKLISGSITEDELAKLEEVLIHDEEARKHYYELIYVSIALKNAEGILSFEEALNFDMDLWQYMAEFEKTAPMLEIPKEKPPRELIQKVVYPPRQKQKVSKFSLVFLVINAVAILFFILFLWITPSKLIEVATLSDSINAKWADIDTSMQNGTRLVAPSNKLMLRKGIAELTFDDHTKAVIEAPAEFQILADDRIGLTYGKVYVMVPPGSIGFSVYTPYTKIIDLGTEFGVQVDDSGDMRLYVLEGKTSLVSGGESNRTSIEVVENTAKRVSGVTQEISDTPYNSRLFIREIDSHNQVVWRGENLELASIIAGGNGLSPVFNGPTLNPNTGDYETKPLKSKVENTNYSYNRVADNVFIDGVFVPDGNNGPVTITSQGHHFNCPETSGKYNRNIAVFYKSYDKAFSDTQPALFDGIVYGSEKRPCVLLHSNVGITIDLDRVREAYPGRELQYFQTGYGLTWAEKRGRVDFFILVDGILKHESQDLVSHENSQTVTIKLESDACFLTFIVTDNQKVSLSTGETIDYDFFYLLEPQLVLK